MYSKVENLPDTLLQREVFIDGKRLDVTKIPIWQEAVVLHSLSMYNWQAQNDFHDPLHELVVLRTKHLPASFQSFVAYKVENHREELATYPDWILQYLQKITHQKIHHVEYKEAHYVYNKEKNEYTFLGELDITKSGK